MTYRVEIVDLTCARGDRVLFGGLSQRVDAGELLHVTGSNGSGKTTLLRTLSGISRPAGGDVRWNGRSIYSAADEYRERLAYVGHLDGVQGELTPVENLRVSICITGARGEGDDAIEKTLRRMGISAYRSFPAKILSQGQRRRLALARLLVAPRPIWILDEPFTALDVSSSRLVNDLLREHLLTGGIGVLSSHQGLDVPDVKLKRLDLDSARAALSGRRTDAATVAG